MHLKNALRAATALTLVSAAGVSAETITIEQKLASRAKEKTRCDGKLKKDAREYVAFHVDDLGCPFCQATLAANEEKGSEEGRRRITRSRERVGEATTVLLGDLRRQRE